MAKGSGTYGCTELVCRVRQRRIVFSLKYLQGLYLQILFDRSMSARCAHADGTEAACFGESIGMDGSVMKCEEQTSFLMRDEVAKQEHRSRLLGSEWRCREGFLEVLTNLETLHLSEYPLNARWVRIIELTIKTGVQWSWRCRGGLLELLTHFGMLHLLEHSQIANSVLWRAKRLQGNRVVQLET